MLLLSRRSCSSVARRKFDAIVIGGGHNGLTAAAYLARAGKKVCVLERRHVLGGAAVTEEIVPGFKFSRCSYVLSLLRPAVIDDLKLKDHGLRYHVRDPSSFTPIRDSRSGLLLGSDLAATQKELAAFSASDAANFPEYERYINRFGAAAEALMDTEPVDLQQSGLRLAQSMLQLRKPAALIGKEHIAQFYELMTAPISKIMRRWFENPALQATLATDGVIGFAASPFDLGTGYVLLHHVMGGLDGRAGSWGYVFGGMGAVSEAIARSARSLGAQILTEKPVASVLTENGRAKGVKLETGEELYSDVVLSNATPHVTFRKLLKEEDLPAEFLRNVDLIDYTSPVTKINVALKELPNFTARPHAAGTIAPHHQATIHINSESMELIDAGFKDFVNGRWSSHPVIEMTLPTSVDTTLVKGGGHVCLLFTQYTPYTLAGGGWDDATKEAYARHVFAEVDSYAPNFSGAVVGYEVLPPPTLEAEFGLTGGNIFHGSMSLDQLFLARPFEGMANFGSPLRGLYLCGSGAHPGGGVTGAPGRLAALNALRAMK